MALTLSLNKIFGFELTDGFYSLFKPLTVPDRNELKTSLINHDGQIVEKRILFSEEENILSNGKYIQSSEAENLKVFSNHPIISETYDNGFYIGAITDYLAFDNEKGCSIGEAFLVGKEGYVLKINYEVNSIKRMYFIDSNVDIRHNQLGIVHVNIPFEIDSKNTFVNIFKYLMPQLQRTYIIQLAGLKN